MSFSFIKYPKITALLPFSPLRPQPCLCGETPALPGKGGGEDYRLTLRRVLSPKLLEDSFVRRAHGGGEGARSGYPASSDPAEYLQNPWASSNRLSPGLREPGGAAPRQGELPTRLGPISGFPNQVSSEHNRLKTEHPWKIRISQEDGVGRAAENKARSFQL